MITAASPVLTPSTPAKQGDPALQPAQKTQIKALLAEYNPSALTRTQARKIVNGLSEIGARPSDELRTLLGENGYDAKKLGEIANADPNAKRAAPTAAPSLKLDGAALDTLQKIADKYDLNNLSKEDKAEIRAKLDEIGINYRGDNRLVNLLV